MARVKLTGSDVSLKILELWVILHRADPWGPSNFSEIRVNEIYFTYSFIH